jgi:hypothetical protein
MLAALDRRTLLCFVVLLCGAALTSGSCAGSRSARGPAAPPADAQAAFAEALGLLAEQDLGPGLERARERLEAAARSAPGWVAPLRQLDDLDRLLLLGPEAWERRLAALASAPFDASALYLAGRLEGGQGQARFVEARQRDARLAWAAHGLSVEAETRGQAGEALAQALMALGSARGDFELALFARRAAQLAPSPARARRTLEQALARAASPDGPVLTGLRFDLARLELGERGKGAAELAERGLWRALELIETDVLEPVQVELLVALATGLPAEGRSAASLRYECFSALARGPNAALLSGSPALRTALTGDSRPPEEDRLQVFRRELAQGRPGRAFEAQFASLPASLRGEGGQPTWPPLRRLWERVREFELAPPAPGGELWGRLAEALLEAGHSAEARALLELRAERARAEQPPPGEAQRLRLLARALAQEALLEELAGLTAALFRGDRSFLLEPLAGTPPSQGLASDPGRGLADVLDALARLAERHAGDLGFDPELPARIRATPRIRYGSFAEVTIPSPCFCRRDEELGHGPAGQPVPGLPEFFARFGRVGLFGKLVGRSTDGTVLRLVGVEERRGEHLGVPFDGLVLYADGADADGARSQQGGRVAGAALHEGYWIDLSIERRRLAVWHELAARWFTPAAAEHRARALAVTGLPLGDPQAPGRDLRRRSALAPLGEAQRVRLGLLEERWRADPAAAPWLDLDELLSLVRTHEEGHLCDRTRFLPLGRNRLAVLAFAAASGFDPGRIEQRLEYRAELTALAAAPEPRLVLAEVLDALEVHPAERSVHGRAYANLAQDLLDGLDRELGRGERFPGIDPQRTLLHQLHRLDAESLRRLALELARREGLVGRG